MWVKIKSGTGSTQRSGENKKRNYIMIINHPMKVDHFLSIKHQRKNLKAIHFNTNLRLNYVLSLRHAQTSMALFLLMCKLGT